VRLEIPLHRTERDDSQGEELQEEAARLLLVEDHATVRDAIAAAFEREAGFEVVAQAGSLEEARGMLEGIDVAVVDLGLPDGHGGDLIRELREKPKGAGSSVECQVGPCLDRQSGGGWSGSGVEQDRAPR
jgi:hypothetical protein